MKKYPVVIDLETKYTFRERNKHEKLEISVMAIYDYTSQTCRIYTENELSKVFAVLENASYVIGFNIKSFDLQVLRAYYPGDVAKFSVFDICDDIKDRVGRRLSLNDLLFATLNKKKTGHGLVAIDLYKQKKMEELKQYCIDDVTLTRELFDFGIREGLIYFLDSKGKKEIPVDWKKYIEESNHQDTHLTLPF